MNRKIKLTAYLSAVAAMYLSGQGIVLADEATASSYKTESGPGGAKISKTKTSVQGNADGTVSANRSHESHTMTDAGTSHHTSNSSTTVAPDGTSASVKQEARTTTP